MANKRPYRLKHGRHRRGGVLLEAGAVFVPTDDELRAFADKFEPVLVVAQEPPVPEGKLALEIKSVPEQKPAAEEVPAPEVAAPAPAATVTAAPVAPQVSAPEAQEPEIEPQPTTPSEADDATASVETQALPLPQPRHVGGGWYAVGDRRVQGRQEAEKLLEDLRAGRA